MNNEEINFINKLLDDIHNINPELSDERQREYTQLLSQPTQGEGEIKEPIYEKVNGIYGYTVIMGGNKYHIYYNSVDDIECYLISESPKAECEGEIEFEVPTCKCDIPSADSDNECCMVCGTLLFPDDEPQTPAELRAEFQHLKMKLNYACYDKDVLSKMGAVWEAMDKLEQKITPTNK